MPQMKSDIVNLATDHLRSQSFMFFQDEMGGGIGAKVNDLTSSIQDLISSIFNVSRQTLMVRLCMQDKSMIVIYPA